MPITQAPRTRGFHGFVSVCAMSASLLAASCCAAASAQAAASGSAPKSTLGTVIVVTTTDDDTTVNGNCTLREAVIAANTDSAVDDCPAGNGVDTIVLPAGNYVLTISGSNEGDAATGDLDVRDDLSIAGAGASATTIDANGLDRVLEVFDGSTLTLSDLTLTGGSTTQAGAGIRVAESSSLNLSGLRITGIELGSALFVLTGSTLTMTRCRIDENERGGIVTQPGTLSNIRDSSISGNVTTSGGAGISSGGEMILVNTTISENAAGSSGGGIANNGTLLMYNVTIADNLSGTEGVIGIGAGLATASGFATAFNSIIAGNQDMTGLGSPDCDGTLESGGFNLVSDLTGCTISGPAIGDIYGASAVLAPLGANGGGTLTHRLLPASPAIDAGDPVACLDDAGFLLHTDQRGFVRSGRCDMGAYEANSPGRVQLFRDGFEEG